MTLRVANNIDPERDIQFTLGPSTLSTMPRGCPTTAARWALTRPGNGPPRALPALGREMIEMDAATKARVDAIWKKLGID